MNIDKYITQESYYQNFDSPTLGYCGLKIRFSFNVPLP
jgi:hypothetical protein